MVAFSNAAAVDANSDSVSDLYPAVRVCKTVAAWSAAFAARKGAGFSGTATSVLANVCLAPEVANETLCAAAGSGQVPLATEALTPDPTAKPDASPIPVKVTSVSKSVRRDGTASVAIKTNPGATCSIDVQYKSGSATAKGLDPKKAGTTGSVVWKWKVGRNTTKGTWPIEIDCRLGDRTGSASTKFTVK
jgi:hypothetical protein